MTLQTKISERLGITPEALKTVLFDEYKYYPENKAEHVWKKGDVIFSLVKQDHMIKSYEHMAEVYKEKGEEMPPFMIKTMKEMGRAYYCGYCRFPKKPLAIENSYMNFLSYVPVHGGITYSESFPDGSIVYGFDTMHHNDHNIPALNDVNYLKMECERMAIGIQMAIDFEEQYLLSSNKAKVIDRFHEELEKKFEIRFNLLNNFGAMVNLMFGNV